MHVTCIPLDSVSSFRRIIFLETVAGVPGMVAAMTRHLRSLRDMQRDYGWIHTLLGMGHSSGVWDTLLGYGTLYWGMGHSIGVWDTLVGYGAL